MFPLLLQPSRNLCDQSTRLINQHNQPLFSYIIRGDWNSSDGLRLLLGRAAVECTRNSGHKASLKFLGQNKNLLNTKIFYFSVNLVWFVEWKCLLKRFQNFLFYIHFFKKNIFLNFENFKQCFLKLQNYKFKLKLSNLKILNTLLNNFKKNGFRLEISFGKTTFQRTCN